MGQNIGTPRYERTTLSATGDVKIGSGVLHGYLVATTTTGTVTLADGLPSPATILVIPSGQAAGTYVKNLDVGFSTKLRATFQTGGTITFVWA